MIHALVYATLSLLVLALALVLVSRRRTVIFATPAVAYGALVGGGYLLARFGHLRVPPFVPYGSTRATMALIGLTFHGYGILLPFAYVVIALVLARQQKRRLAATVGVTSIVLLALASWALFIEPARLEVRSQSIHSSRAPARPLRILHISDIQTDGPCRREHLAATLATNAEPDLAIITGDLANDLYLEDRAQKIQAVNGVLRSIHARYGAFLVRGDWDGWDEDWPATEHLMLEGTTVRVLSNEATRIAIDGSEVVVYGVEGGHGMADPAFADLTSDPALRIFAMHHPDLAAQIPPGGADLVMAGHTHGGQVVLPFVGALITHSEQGYVGGRYDVNGIPLVISRGIGMRGGPAPRVRFGCPPEIGIVSISR